MVQDEIQNTCRPVTSNHLANTYRLKVLSSIASLCTLSKDFFHYGFFNGTEVLMDGCATGLTQSNGESKPIQDCIEISTVRSCGYSESHQARLQDQEEINNSTVECRGAHGSSSVRRLRNQQLLMPVYQFEMDAIEIDLDALIVHLH